MTTKIKNLAKRGTQKRDFQNLILLYQQEHPDTPAGSIDRDELCKWAVAHGHWRAEPISPEEQLGRKLATFLKGERLKDPQGREVRKYQTVVTSDQRSISYPIFEAPPEHMRMAVQLRRRSTANDVRQIATDMESYNDNNLHGATLPFVDFDFNKDLEESKQPTSWPSEAPEDGEDDE